MTFYVTSPNFDVLSVIINLLLAKNHRENILKRTISAHVTVTTDTRPLSQSDAKELGQGVTDYYVK